MMDSGTVQNMKSTLSNKFEKQCISLAFIITKIFKVVWTAILQLPSLTFNPSKTYTINKFGLLKQNKHSLDMDHHMYRIAYEPDKNTKTVTTENVFDFLAIILYI
jgi:hypothetical protein